MSPGRSSSSPSASRRPRGAAWLVVAATVAFLPRFAEAGCYRPDGGWHDGLQPCNPSAAVSACCGGNDWCLDNGLCLNGGGNNGFSQQGCTDKNWAAPCEMHCPKESWSTGDGYAYLSLCTPFNGNANVYACGDDTTQCSNSSALIAGIPLFHALNRPGVVNTATTSNTVSTPTGIQTTTTIGAGNSPTSTGAGFDNSGASETGAAGTGQQAAASEGGGGTNVVAIAAGIGVPLGLALIGALAFLAWQMRRMNEIKATQHAMQSHLSAMGSPWTAAQLTELYRADKDGFAARSPTELPGTTVVEAQGLTSQRHELGRGGHPY